MKYIERRALVVIALVMMALSSVAIPTKYSQGIYGNDIYAMSEPFSTGPLVMYPSLEASRGDF